MINCTVVSSPLHENVGCRMVLVILTTNYINNVPNTDVPNTAHIVVRLYSWALHLYGRDVLTNSGTRWRWSYCTGDELLWSLSMG